MSPNVVSLTKDNFHNGSQRTLDAVEWDVVWTEGDWIFSAQVSDWSTAMEAKVSVNLQAAYYNSVLALWEPLLEPVEYQRHGGVRQRPWELTASVRVLAGGASPPLTEIAFESADTMELTVSRTLLDVLALLADSFGRALRQQLSRRDVPAAHYVVRNDLDIDVVLDLLHTDFVVTDPAARSTTQVVS